MWARASWLPIILGFCALPQWSGAATFDLKTDWSDGSNPNGTWSYNVSGSPAGATFRTGDTWGTPQPSWGTIPGWFKSNGTEAFAHDWIAGDVITHSTAVGAFTDIVWTNPSNGNYDIAGNIWCTREIGRFNNWEVRVAGTVVASGFVGTGDPFDRNSPMPFSVGALPGALNNVFIAAGQNVQLRVSGADANGDYAGVNMSLTLVPEPASLVALTATSMLLLRRRAK